MAGVKRSYANGSSVDAASFPLLREHDAAGFALIGSPNSGQDIASLILNGNPNRDQDAGFAFPGQNAANFALIGKPHREHESANLAFTRMPYREPASAGFAITGRPVRQQGSAVFSLPSEPFREPGTAGFAPIRNTLREPHVASFALTGMPHRGHDIAGFALSRRAHSSEQANARLAFTADRAVREQNIAGFPLTERAKRKQDIAGFPLPGCLARSFASTEMEEIAKAIVRVNDFGQTATSEGPEVACHEQELSCQPLLLASSNREEASLFDQETGDHTGACDDTDTTFISACDGGGMKVTTSKILPSVGAFTVQCAKCMKWRLIPSKEQYEKIRHFILEKPFFCSSTALWRPGASCNDPTEFSEDRNYLWAIDKPNIPLAPNGWERSLVIRGAGASKFADIYYIAPSGKKLRSMREIERFLAEHPEYVNAGVSLSQFSFIIPRALDDNYCRKRTLGSPTIMRGSIAHKNTLTNNLGVRYQPLKAFSSKDELAKSLAPILGDRQSKAAPPSFDYAGNTPIATQPA